MYKRHRDAWVKALREGKQDLTSGNMRSSLNPCALAMGLIASDIGLDSGARYTWFGSEDSQRRDVGNSWPIIRYDLMLGKDQHIEIYKMSDQGIPAAKIADWIEANVPIHEEPFSAEV